MSTDTDHWWNWKLVYFNGDGFTEIVLADYSTSGGWFGYYERTSDGECISDSTRFKGTFTGGDIETVDFDRDGSMDALRYPVTLQ